MNKVVFLDRDGVINKDSPSYIKNLSEFEFIPGSLDAVKYLTSEGFTIIVITNQSAINRNLTTRKIVDDIHSMIMRVVKSEFGEIKDIFLCPHTPEQDCTCRKPKPGLIHQAQKKYNIDISSSCMVGDSAKDIECARNAGCRYAILVKTGNADDAEKILTDKNISPDYVAENLFEAARWIISNFKKDRSYAFGISASEK